MDLVRYITEAHVRYARTSVAIWNLAKHCLVDLSYNVFASSARTRWRSAMRRL